MVYPFSVMIIAAVASLAFLCRIERNRILPTKFFFWHYTIGFAILSLVNLPIFLINYGVQISYNYLVILYCISFFAVLFSYLLFYRGTILLITKNRFFTTVFPLIFLPAFAAVAIIFFFLFKVEIFSIYTAVVWGFLIPLNGFLSSLFLYFFFRGAPFDTIKRRPCAIILSLGWFLLTFVDILLWLNVAVYPREFWVLKIASAKEWYFLRGFSYLLILIGSLLYSRYLGQPKTLEK